MTDVESRLKPDPEVCVCGCGLVGNTRAKAWGDGLGPHVRRCACRRCVGGRQRSKASRRERRIATATAGERAPLSGALSGYDGRSGLFVWEETAQESLVRGIRRWWEGKGVRTKCARLLALRGVYRAFICSWDGKPRVAVMPYEDYAALVREAAGREPGRSRTE